MAEELLVTPYSNDLVDVLQPRCTEIATFHDFDELLSTNHIYQLDLRLNFRNRRFPKYFDGDFFHE